MFESCPTEVYSDCLLHGYAPADTSLSLPAGVEEKKVAKTFVS